MIEIGMDNIQKVLPLYSGWDHHMSIQAAAEGEATAQVWADSVDSPNTAALCFGVRLLVSGNLQGNILDWIRRKIPNLLYCLKDMN